MKGFHLVVGLVVVLGSLKRGNGLGLDSSKCGKSMGCFLSPGGCTSPTPNGGNSSRSECSFAVSYKPVASSDWVEFEMQAKIMGVLTSAPSFYIALGLSADGKMPKSSVIACIHEPAAGKNVDRVILAYNPEYFSTTIPNAQILEANAVKFIEGGYNNGVFYCRFQRLVEVANAPEVFPLNKPHFLLLAEGPAEKDKLHKHTEAPLSSAEAFLLNSRQFDVEQGTQEVGTVSKSTQEALLIVHGVLMLFGWWIFVPIAIIFARYFRTSWPGHEPFGHKLWFHFHRTLNFVAVGLIVVAFVCIMVKTKGVWLGNSTEGTLSLHAIVGLAAFIAILIQPIMAFARCHPTHRFRPIFNYTHRLIGTAALACASAAIWFTTSFGVFDKKYGAAPAALMIFFFCATIAVSIAFEVFEIVVYIRQRRATSVDIPLQSNEQPRYSDLGSVGAAGKRRDRVHGVLLGILVCCSLGATIALSAMLISSI